jgi:hypothetical protein
MGHRSSRVEAAALSAPRLRESATTPRPPARVSTGWPWHAHGHRHGHRHPRRVTGHGSRVTALGSRLTVTLGVRSEPARSGHRHQLALGEAKALIVALDIVEMTS